MVVEINTEYLIQTGLTANQFLLAQLIYERHFMTLSKLKLEFAESIKQDLDILTGAGYLTQSAGTHLITPKFVSILKKEGKFEEFFNTYPISVLRPDGNKDYLRVNKASCKTRYNNLIKKTKTRHDFIVSCLKFEIETRTKEGSLSYMKRMPNWLSSREWEAWAERMEDEVSLKSTSDYGQELE